MNLRLTLLLFLLTLTLGCASAQVRLFSPAGGNAPQQSWVLPEFSEEGARAIVRRTPRGGIEGIWQATADGARIAIIPGRIKGVSGRPGEGSADNLLLVVLSSPRPGIVPGTVMGWGKPTARRNHWDVTLFTHTDGRTLRSPRRFTMTADGGDRSLLQLTEVHRGVAVNVWRMLPYMFRRAFTNVDDRQKGLDGFTRCWPPSPDSPPLTPVYL